MEHRQTGLSVLGTVPWDSVTTSDGSFAAADERRWLTRYTGGWPLLFPNAGGACVVDGTVHGFHGEASIAPWAVVTRTRAGLRLRRRFFTVPVTMEREMSLDGGVLTVNERIIAHGERPVHVLWGQHVTFGSDLLAGDFVIDTGATMATVDQTFDPPSNPLSPGTSGAWPSVPGKDGRAFDLSRPAKGFAAMAYLNDFDGAWASVSRSDGSLAAVLSWDAAVYPCAWLWYELGGTTEAPWHGRGRLLGIEPCSTWPELGLERSISRDLPLVTLRPGSETTTIVRLSVAARGEPPR